MEENKGPEEQEPIDLEKYRGEWLAFIHGRIIAHGRRLDVVAREAEKIDSRPIYHKVPTHDILVV